MKFCNVGKLQPYQRKNTSRHAVVGKIINTNSASLLHSTDAHFLYQHNTFIPYVFILINLNSQENKNVSGDLL